MTLRGMISLSEWVDTKQTQPTETEIYSKISELDNAEPMRLLRIERDKELQRQIGDVRETLQMLKHQALRDLPASASPKNLRWIDLTSVTW